MNLGSGSLQTSHSSFFHWYLFFLVSVKVGVLRSSVVVRSTDDFMLDPSFLAQEVDPARGAHAFAGEQKLVVNRVFGRHAVLGQTVPTV
jgi:hypothetical protein